VTLAIGSVRDLQVGDIGFASIRGRVGAGVLAGQTGIDLAGLLRGKPGTTAGWITHAFMVTSVDDPFGYWEAEVVEAMPAGARRITITDQAGGPPERCGPGFAYVRLRDEVAYPGIRNIAGTFAEHMIGTPYGFGQYAAIAGLVLSGGSNANPDGVLARYVSRRHPDDFFERNSPVGMNTPGAAPLGRPRRAICSQLVDEAYRAAGVQLFDDGRPPAYVTPGALFWRTAQLGDVCIC
jgi:hypothetical protein